MDGKLLKRLSNLQTMNALLTARELYGANNPLLYELEEALCDVESDTELFDAVNKAMCNPYARMALYDTDSAERILQWLHRNSITVGSMSPKLFMWLKDSTYDEYSALRHFGVFIDLQIMSEWESYIGMSGTKEYTTEFGPVQVDVSILLSEENVRAWYDTYLENWDKIAKDIRRDLDTRYKRLWKECEARFRDVTKKHCLTMSVDDTIGSFPLDCLKDYLFGSKEDHNTLLYGNKYNLPFTRDLDCMANALGLKSIGESVITVSLQENGDAENVMLYSIDSVLSKERLRKLADGYVPYATEQAKYLYGDPLEPYTKEYAKFLEHFPSIYVQLINYMYDTVCTDDEKIRSVVPLHLCSTVEKMLPEGWEDMSMEDLRGVLESATAMAKD